MLGMQYHHQMSECVGGTDQSSLVQLGLGANGNYEESVNTPPHSLHVQLLNKVSRHESMKQEVGVDG